MAVEAVSGNGGEAAAPAPAKEVSAKEVVAVSKNASFREESNFLDDLKESERKALADLRDKVEAAIVEGKLFDDGKPEVVKEKEEAKKKAVEKKEEEPETEAKVEEDGKKEADVEEEKKEGEEEGEKKEAEEESGEDTKEEAKKEEAAEKAAAKEEEEKPAETTTAAVVVVHKDIALWGVPLLPSKGDEATDVVLLKFLRARDFKAGAAFEMLRRTLRWRRDWAGFSADADADLPEELAGACYLDGADREGHPVCYNALGVFADDAVYKKALGTEEGKARFLRWRVRAMERHVAELDLRPGGAASLLQVTDLKNSPGPAKKDLRVAVKQVLDLFQDNYPELVARNILINVPFWYYAFSALFYPFLTQRTKSKFVVARPSKVTETLLKYIPIEAIPVKYGGLKRDGDTEFSADDGESVTEVTVKGSSTQTIEIEAIEGDATLTWDLTVLGWEVNYKEEFVPADEGSYTIIIRKGKKMGTGEEAVRNSFRAGEPGKVVLTVENTSHRKKKVLFRHKAKSACAKKC
ncbi:hypothetical protein BDA96_10G290800 [Sorghum bicolor]|uniref:CRAL-TRIO domain-containing protein n=2 Tax=Sorghum bicolor TaxID=4558 RepID=A0A921Q560_SORBI|nr:patellin-4 [Sorghum bicolor]EER88801.1 hypothetical protein SORBI_3010G224800 [Sorghum bicolor]KAG0515583.1 hypothetical protein BDA96_10G290800 [Sorghum bicolor]|eukprot:XP_002437434.1 patellin-4 [Sorghum bicolor]